MSTPVTIGDIVAPDSELACKAAALAERAHAKVLFNQVHRTWWFAEFIGRKREMKYDRKLVYIASLLHDVGLSEKYAALKRFEVDGAHAESEFLRAHHYPRVRTGIVWDAIPLHSAPDIADRGQCRRVAHGRRAVNGSHVAYMSHSKETAKPIEEAATSASVNH